MKKLIFSLITFFAATQVMAQEYRASYTGIDDVKLTTGSGDVDISKSSDNSVVIRLEHEMGDNYKPEIRQNGDNLIIQDGDKNLRGKMHWFITLPDDISMNLTTGSGDVAISGLKIDLKTINGSGDVGISNAEGYISSTTGSGDIDISDFSGEFKGNTGSGDAEVNNISGMFSLNCGSGDIDIRQSNAEINANVGSGSIDVSELTLAGNSNFNSGSGDVIVSLGATPAYDLNINSGSGDAELDRNNHALNADIEMTASKSKGKIVAPFTFDKEEEIDKNGYVQIKKTVSVGSGTKVKVSIGTGSGVARIR